MGRIYGRFGEAEIDYIEDVFVEGWEHGQDGKLCIVSSLAASSLDGVHKSQIESKFQSGFLISNADMIMVLINLERR